MTKTVSQKYPAYKWHPDGGDAILVNDASEDDPVYLDRHPSQYPEGLPTHPDKVLDIDDDSTEAMSRDDVLAALERGGIEYAKNYGNKRLRKLLRKTLLGVLEGSEKDFKGDTPLCELLNMVEAG